jgi:hypothetical protein
MLYTKLNSRLQKMSSNKTPQQLYNLISSRLPAGAHLILRLPQQESIIIYDSEQLKNLVSIVKDNTILRVSHENGIIVIKKINGEEQWLVDNQKVIGDIIRLFRDE